MMVIPPVTAKQMQKVLGNLGWKMVNEYGSHQYYRSGEFPKRLITLPVYDNDTLPLKVLVKILDEADLGFADLVWFM
jgi:predicted RNA binding protein YcfA (HicA-like mRNA interferase family)